MKRITLLGIFILASILTYGQFKSESDVLFYLNEHQYENEENGANLFFKEMGSQLILNEKYLFYEPKVVIYSETLAVVTYELVEDPEQKACLVVETTKEVIMDCSSKRIYKKLW
jgi:hypothetical protein